MDDSTRQVLDDYSRRLLGFIQQEKEKVRKQARDESARVLADAQSRGQLAYEQIVKDANAEAERVTASSREYANQITGEMQRLLQSMVELREKTQKDVDDIRNRLQLEAASVVESIRRTDKAIADSKAKLAKEFEASASSLTQAMQGLRIEPKTRQAPERPQSTNPQEDVVEGAADIAANPTRSEEFSKKHNEKAFSGTINLEIEKGSSPLLKRFKEALAKVPGLEISATDDYSKERARVVAFASRPIILMNILNQMALVKSVVVDKNAIQIVLQDPDRWVG
jgi:membrane-associated HD superfamily phosphohydrolase